MAELVRCVAVTSCPAGAMHTQMASQSLVNGAKKLGIDFKVELQGAFGVQDELTRQDIESAQVVIFAADIAIADQERFEGKKILKVRTPEAIAKPAEVFRKAEALLQE
jgi:fructose-specific phosphotransferase system IIB component